MMKSKIGFVMALVAVGGALIGLGIVAQQDPAPIQSALQHPHGASVTANAPTMHRNELAQATPGGQAGGDSASADASAASTPGGTATAGAAPGGTVESTTTVPNVDATVPNTTATEGAAPATNAAAPGSDFQDDGSEIVILTPEGKNREAKSGLETNEENLINIHLDDVEMVDVVRMFTQISGINIIATPSNLQGRVTVSLTGVQWRPALESILDMHGLSLIEKRPDSNVFSVVPKIGDVEPMTTETIFLKYSSASQVNDVVKGLLPAGASTTAFPSRGALVLRTTSSSMADIHKLIEQIDRFRDQVFIEAKFMELTDSAIKDLGIDWQSLAGTTITASSLQDSYSQAKTWDQARTDTSDTYQNQSSYQEATHAYDTAGNEYTAAGATAGTPTTDPSVSSAGTTPTYGTYDTISSGQNLDSQIADTFDNTVSDVKTAVLSATDFKAVLAALKQTEGVSIVSNPKIIVANEIPATIHIGDVVRPFLSSVTPGSQNAAPVITYNPGEPVDLGVKLTVTPTINTASNITLNIAPELTSSIRNETAPNGETYPIINTKKITTVFTLESGKTVAIGGLTQTTEDQKEHKVPLLGDIPIIGKYLFTYSHEEKDQVETIIFVTVNLAKPEEIDPEIGLPVDTELAKKRMIVEDIRHKQVKDEVSELKDASDEDVSLKDERVKDRLSRKIE